MQKPSVLTPQIAGHNLKNKLGLIKFGNYDKTKTEIYTRRTIIDSSRSSSRRTISDNTQVSEEMSRVSDRADTDLALDSSGDTASFANRMMNENDNKNNQEVLISLNKTVQLIGG